MSCKPRDSRYTKQEPRDTRSAQEERGISVAELARRTNISYEALRVSLKGKRGITAPELVSLCRELNLDVDDFPDDLEELDSAV